MQKRFTDHGGFHDYQKTLHGGELPTLKSKRGKYLDVPLFGDSSGKKHTWIRSGGERGGIGSANFIHKQKTKSEEKQHKGEEDKAEDHLVMKNTYLGKVKKLKEQAKQERAKKLAEAKKEADILYNIDVLHKGDAHKGHVAFPTFYGEFMNPQKDIHFTLMECVPGGSLEDAKDAKSEKAIRFYAGVLLLALEELHNVYGIWHTDLKPGNIRLAGNGYPKIIDFNSAEFATKPKDPVVRSIFYSPPELIHGKPDFNHGTDIYSMAAVLCQVAFGKTPSRDEKKKKVKVPENNFSKEGKDFLEKALDYSHHTRLGQKDYKELRGHPWFTAEKKIKMHDGGGELEPFDFEAALHQTMQAPHVPQKKHC